MRIIVTIVTMADPTTVMILNRLVSVVSIVLVVVVEMG
jgi:hypothetical protein